MISIEILTGDITQIECDALVNAANNHFWMGGGVAGALKKAGGLEIETEAMKKGPVTPGEVVVTGAGKLKARYIIHAAVMEQNLQTDAVKIRQATCNSLRKAEELGVRCLAFPALGTGVGSFPIDECARVMLTEVRQFARRETVLNKVNFVLFHPLASEAFQRQLSKLEG